MSTRSSTNFTLLTGEINIEVDDTFRGRVIEKHRKTVNNFFCCKVFNRNTVSTVNFGCTLDLIRISWHGRNTG
jgi:hypothetical protein